MSYPMYGHHPPDAPTPLPYRLPPPNGQQQLRPRPMPTWGPPPAPPRSSSLPWLFGGLVALLIAGGIGLGLLLQNDFTRVVADPPTQSIPGGDDVDTGSESRQVPSPPSDCLVECTDPEPPDGPDAADTGDANYSGSDAAATGFVQAIADGDVISAHEALCGAGKNRFATPEELIADFYATLGFTTITGARLTDVYAADSSADAVVFELETDVGDLDVEVYIVEEGSSLTVCGYDTL